MAWASIPSRSAPLGVASILARCIAALLFADVRPVVSLLASCAHDTWGLNSKPKAKPYEPGIEELQRQCEWRYRDAKDVQQIVVNHYKDDWHFRAYKGVDLVPERHWEYPESGPRRRNLKTWLPGVNGPMNQTRHIQLAECELLQEDGGAYAFQRIGPFVSTGGYDYWQLGLRDVGLLRAGLARHAGGLAVTSSFSGPVLPNGTALGYPPVHIHHIHISPEPGVKAKLMDGRAIPNHRNVNGGYVANLVLEQHGDYQCVEADGGSECFFERVADGYAKVVTSPLDLEGELNDARAPGSAPLEWWYQVAVRWRPYQGSGLRPLSQHFHIGFGPYNNSNQMSELAVFPVRSDVDSLFWYTGRMSQDGALLRNKVHAHNALFRRAYWFHATPSDLGLHYEGLLKSSRTWTPKQVDELGLQSMATYAEETKTVPIKELGFDTFDSLESHLTRNLAEAARRHDSRCQSSVQLQAQAANCTDDDRPAAICNAEGATADVVDPQSGLTFSYDRRSPTCCRPWNFRKGDIFTVVGFMGPAEGRAGHGLGPWAPEAPPPKVPMHLHWVLHYEAHASGANRSYITGPSYYTMSQHGRNPDVQLVHGDAARAWPEWAPKLAWEKPRGWPGEPGADLASPSTPALIVDTHMRTPRLYQNRPPLKSLPQPAAAKTLAGASETPPATKPRSSFRGGRAGVSLASTRVVVRSHGRHEAWSLAQTETSSSASAAGAIAEDPRPTDGHRGPWLRAVEPHLLVAQVGVLALLLGACSWYACYDSRNKGSELAVQTPSCIGTCKPASRALAVRCLAPKPCCPPFFLRIVQRGS